MQTGEGRYPLSQGRAYALLLLARCAVSQAQHCWHPTFMYKVAKVIRLLVDMAHHYRNFLEQSDSRWWPMLQHAPAAQVVSASQLHLVWRMRPDSHACSSGAPPSVKLSIAPSVLRCHFTARAHALGHTSDPCALPFASAAVQPLDPTGDGREPRRSWRHLYLSGELSRSLSSTVRWECDMPNKEHSTELTSTHMINKHISSSCK